ncbi:hypothetical protein [Bordetella sp. LUAb4]|uniref:hypothetical protein n=1 Tax=Bordetella sp. LUAb4 TaxID=2843195 RepID=UPI001E32D15D|nr:hypothetical protein [Bordetella sp. LUAb4]
MTIINNSLRDTGATSHFIDAQAANSSVRGFGELDSISHAVIDQANIAGDDRTLYGVDIPRITDLIDIVTNARGIVTTPPDAQAGDTGSRNSLEEIHIPTGGQPLA